MRNRRLGRKLGVKTKHRKAMFRNMATELFRHGGIQTTDAKAKELKRVADKIITLAKNGAREDAPAGGLSYKRRIFGYIQDKEVARKLLTEIAEMHKDRPGGYSRIIPLGYRKGDQTPVSRIELVTEEYKPSSKKKAKKKAAPPPKEAEGTERSTGGSETDAAPSASATESDTVKETAATVDGESGTENSPSTDETAATVEKSETVSEKSADATAGGSPSNPETAGDSPSGDSPSDTVKETASATEAAVPEAAETEPSGGSPSGDSPSGGSPSAPEVAEPEPETEKKD